MMTRPRISRDIQSLISRPTTVILFLMLVSVLLRLHAFGGPIPGSHGWLTAHTIITNHIWQQDGLNTYKYNPVYSFSNQTDKNLRSLASGLADAEGNYYYVSYPPFSFYLSYLFINISRLNYSFESFYILNIIIQTLISFLLYALICSLYRTNYTNHICKPALAGSALYIFSTQNLWCHLFVYFADTLIQLLWVSIIFFSFHIFRRNKTNSKKYLFLLSISIFLAVYTEWLGLFAAFTLFMISAGMSFKHSTYLKVALLIAFSTSLALILTITQFSHVDGLESFINTSVSKYSDRNGYNYSSFYFTQLKITRLGLHYLRMPKTNLFLIVTLSLIALSFLKSVKTQRIPDHLFIIFSILTPILLHHSVFLEFSSMHDFSTLKTSVLFCVIAAFLFQLNSSLLRTNNLSHVKITSFAFSVFILVNILSYYTHISFSSKSTLKEASSIIGSSSDSTEVLFAMSKGDRENGVMVFMGDDRAFSTQIQMLTKRNILAVPSRDQAMSTLKTLGAQKAKIFLFDQHGILTGIESIHSQ